MSGGTQTHELRLLINASAAETGAKRFKGAVASIKRAVEGLERSTDGTFKNLKKGMQVNPGRGAETALNNTAKAANRTEQAAQRLATATTNAMTTATGQASKLRAQFEAMGDASGIQRVEAALARLQSRAGKAGGTADLGAAKADYRATTAGLQAEARASEAAAKASAAHAAELVALKTKYDPIFAASKLYEKQLGEVNAAHAAGVLSASQHENAIEHLNTQLQMGVVSSNKYSQSVRVSSMHMSGATANMVAQFNDIGVMLAAGQSPLLLAMQQGTQLSQVLNQIGGGPRSVLGALKGGFLSMLNPVSLLTIGTIALGAALFQAFTKGREKTKSFAESLSGARSALNELRSASYALAGGNLRQLRQEYGKVNDELDAHLERLQKVAQIEAATKNADLAASIRESLTSDGNPLTGDVDAVRRAFDTTNDRARTFLFMLEDIRNAHTFADQAAAITKLRKEVESTTGGLDKAEGAGRGMLAQLIRAEDFALKLLHAMDGTSESTNRSKSAAGGLTASIGTAADEAARLLQNLTSVPGALSLMGKSVEQQIAGLNAQNESIGLQLSEGLSAMAANRRVQLQDMIDTSKERGQIISPDQIAKEWAAINELDAAAKKQEELRKRLNDANKPTKKGGGHRRGVLDEIVRTTEGLEAQAYAWHALAEGQYSSEEAARLYGQVMAENNGKIDEETAALLANLDAYAARNERLGEVPEAFADTMYRATESSLETAVRDGLMGKKVTFQDFARAIQAEVAAKLAKGLSGEIMTGLGLDKLFGAGGNVAAAQMQAGIITGGNIAAQTMATAISTGQATSAATGGTGGDWLSTAVQVGLSLFGFDEGVANTSNPAAWQKIPAFAEGTANTSGGMPAVLHPNEAVIPLSRGRKVPVEMSGGAGGGVTINGGIHTAVKVEGGDDSPQNAARIGQAVRESIEGMIDTRIAEAAGYGGALNPRGGW
ncbi:phage tail length tape measure family protein [Thalassovita sp.]|uniref:phage tail length tape measure family protein n=1 Tax=Thalassovita sp. TaxID=1979401 RepID=UPI002B271387|nr:phage tail length tape measure family protein [Thalassovita sp.]